MSQIPAKQNKTKPNKTISLSDSTKMDINFPEFCFGIIGKIPKANQPDEITYQDKKDPNKYIKIVRSIYGFPDQSTRDLLMCLLRLTLHKNNFREQKVPISANSIFKEMGLTPSGAGLKILRKNLRILQGTSIEMQNSFFDKQGKAVKDTVVLSLLSGFRIREMEKNYDETGEFMWGWIWWSELFFDVSLENARNLIDVNYTFYRSISGDIAKQLFLFLNKRSYNQASLRLELDVLVFEKLGMNTNLPIAKIRQQLRKASQNLFDQGFLKQLPFFEKHPYSGKEYITFYFYPSLAEDQVLQATPLIGNTERDIVAEIMIKLGMTEGQVGRFFKQYDVSKLRQNLEFVDFIQNHSKTKIQKITNLFADILLHSDKYDFSEFENWKKDQEQSKQREVEREAQRQQEYEQEQAKAEREVAIKKAMQEWLEIPQNELKYETRIREVINELDKARGKEIDYKNMFAFYDKHFKLYKEATNKLMTGRKEALDIIQKEFMAKLAKLPPQAENQDLWMEKYQELDAWRSEKNELINQDFQAEEERAKVVVVKTDFKYVLERWVRKQVETEEENSSTIKPSLDNKATSKRDIDLEELTGEDLQTTDKLDQEMKPLAGIMKKKMIEILE